MEKFRISEIFIFVSQTYIVTVHWGNMEVVNTVYEKAKSAANIFERGIDFLLYNLLDEIIYDYFPIVDEI
ncbi:MAG: CorA family divalent cation transporter [Thermoanaerobacteraceae bacterium]